MSYPVDLDIHEQPVLIIGGGAVALRKCKQCLAQGAKVSILSQELLDDFYQLPVTIRRGPYQKEVLDKFLFCIVCTNQPNFQTQVIEDAKAKLCFVMGVHSDDLATMHPMVNEEYPFFHIALSTKGNCPAMASQLAKEAGNFIQEKEQERIVLLSQLRAFAKQRLSKEKRHEFARFLTKASLPLLRKFVELFQCHHVRILCYHGVKNMEVQASMHDFEEDVQRKYPMDGIISCFLAESVCDVVNKEELRIVSLDTLLFYFSEIKDMTNTLYPMLFQNGHYYQKVGTWANANTHIDPIPFSTKEELHELFACIENKYSSYDLLVIRYHSSCDGTFQKFVEEYKQRYQRIHFLNDKEPFEMKFSKPQKILVYPLYMLQGDHFSKDVQQQEAWKEKIVNQGHQLTYSTKSFIEHQETRRLLLQKL